MFQYCQILENWKCENSSLESCMRNVDDHGYHEVFKDLQICTLILSGFRRVNESCSL